MISDEQPLTNQNSNKKLHGINSKDTMEQPESTNAPQYTSNMQNLLTNPALLPILSNLMQNLQNNAAKPTIYSKAVTRTNYSNNPYQSQYYDSQHNESQPRSHYRASNKSTQPDSKSDDNSSKLITIKFKPLSSFQSYFKNYFNLQKEIKRCKPTAKVQNAYISSRIIVVA